MKKKFINLLYYLLNKFDSEDPGIYAIVTERKFKNIEYRPTKGSKMFALDGNYDKEEIIFQECLSNRPSNLETLEFILAENNIYKAKIYKEGGLNLCITIRNNHLFLK